ncbi:MULTISPECIES: lipoprotein [unclassified Streptomyces]|uniref:lipoprotein n=1 Tax=unclassified Streptomyces TaxID=2593676 RepID=UPI0036F6FA8B
MPGRAPFLRTALLAAAALLTACGTTPEPGAPASGPSATKPSGTPTGSAAPKAVKSVGGPGTACALPVSFSLTAGWEPETVEKPEDPDFAALVEQGPATIVCEAKSEGTPDIGFLRVWTAPKGPVRATLTAFVKDDKTKGLVLTDVRLGGTAAVEARYSVYSALEEEWRDGRSFAVGTAKGTVVVELGGLDAEEDAVVAAYELAKSTLKLT